MALPSSEPIWSSRERLQNIWKMEEIPPASLQSLVNGRPCFVGAHQDIQSMKQYLTWAHFGALQDLINGIHLGPILELTKITETMFESKLELSKFHYLKHILGPEKELTKIFNL